MEEQWKVLIEIKRKGKSYTYLDGDIIYVSNTGKVKLNDMELTIGKGLGIDLGGYPRLLLISNPYKSLHRAIYSLFVGDIPKGYQIHHKDYNKLNNSIDNLECLTPVEHGFIHMNDQLDEYLWEKITESKEITELNLSNENKYLNDWREYLKERSKEHNSKIDEINKTKSKERRKSKQLEKELKNKIKKEQKAKEDAEKLATGDYIITKSGKLFPKHRTWGMSEEIRKAQGEKIKALWQSKDNPWKNMNEARKKNGVEPFNKGKTRVWIDDTHTKYYYK